MSYNSNCPRCKTTATAHVGRQDIGILERHMYICAKCGLVFGITDADDWKDKAWVALAGEPKE